VTVSSRLRVLVVGASLCTSLLATVVVLSVADADSKPLPPSSSCSIAGSVSPAVVKRGENVTVTASVGPGSFGPCGAASFQVTGGNFVLQTVSLQNGAGHCTIVFGAFDGLSAIDVVVSNGQRAQIGTVTVLPPDGSSPATSPRPRRTVTVTASASRVAASSSVPAASRAAAAASAARAATRTRTSTVTSTAFPSESAAPSTAAPSSAAAHAADATPGAFSVNVRTDPSGGSSLPFLPVLIALLVLAGFVTAAGRFIYAHLHEEIEA
jgi:hypothetical protein